MGLFFPSKKIMPTGVSGGAGSSSSLHKYDRNSRGKIMSNEMSYIQRKLINSLGHQKAERVMEHLHDNMDTDGGFGSKNVSSHEVDALMKTLERSHYNRMDSDDLHKTREILDEYK